MAQSRSGGTPRIIEYMTRDAPVQLAFVARGRVVKTCENGLLEVIDIDTGRLMGVTTDRFVRDIPPPEKREPHIAALENERSRLLEVKIAILEELAVADADDELGLRIEKNQVDSRLGQVFEQLMKDA